MDERYQRQTERIVRDPAIESFARSFDIETEEVQSLYESVLTEMKREAIITDFLPIFVARRVKDRLLLKKTSPGT
ncbi:MAG: DUF3562 domain-containing protein [Syntrophorhabdales bacterium]|jgi:hypothetical protein